ncbi:MAG: HAMP domain-containing sensor histidine kinase [Endomicrobiaceae bacterium]|nr:HAMP domain-containing sensor histidine kinase [Endomicrobiaceae bacterium]
MTEKTYTLTKKELNAEKNKAIARFASVASHDLKNVLGGLSNIAYYFSKAFKVEGETPNAMLKLLSSEVANLNTRITDLLDMTRVKQLSKVPCDLQDIINEAITDTKVDGITFELQLLSAKIYADPLRMKQVFVSIIKNSKDAMQNKGTISIKMNIENNTINTEIIDYGIGMDGETLENCLDPMFSTKLAKAVGMGLTIANQIVEMHTGTLSITSEKDKGTKVLISLSILNS